MQRGVPERVRSETLEFVWLALHFPRRQIGALKDLPDGLKIPVLDLGVLSREAPNEIKGGFGGEALETCRPYSFGPDFFNGYVFVM